MEQKHNKMKETIKKLNELRDLQNSLGNYEVSLKIGEIIHVLIDEYYNKIQELAQQHHSEQIKLINKVYKTK